MNRANAGWQTDVYWWKPENGNMLYTSSVRVTQRRPTGLEGQWFVDRVCFNFVCAAIALTALGVCCELRTAQKLMAGMNGGAHEDRLDKPLFPLGWRVAIYAVGSAFLYGKSSAGAAHHNLCPILLHRHLRLLGLQPRYKHHAEAALATDAQNVLALLEWTAIGCLEISAVIGRS